MAKKKKASKDEDKPKRRKPLSKTRYGATQLDMALLEYVRSGYSTWEAEKVSEVHHTAIQRAWDALSEDERNAYRDRAQTIVDLVQENITSNEVSIITEYTSRLKDISDLAIAEIGERLKDPLRRTEIKDADLIAMVTKCLAIINENTQQIKEDNKPTERVTNIFNIMDNSIQENLTLTSMQYEKE